MSRQADDTKRRAGRIYRKLAKEYPDATCALEHRNPFELLIATILSAQCTDKRVNMVTPDLFKKYPTPFKMAEAKREDIEKLIQSTGFYRNKTKSIRGAAMGIVDDHDGDVPRTMDELLKLPGVARKTANVVLGNAFGINEGVVVDTHIRRLSNRMALTAQSDPKKIEQDLIPLFPRKNWTMLAHLLIWHGRAVCDARKPLCDDCCVAKNCPRIGVG
jgi:endonuclease-3